MISFPERMEIGYRKGKHIRMLVMSSIFVLLGIVIIALSAQRSPEKLRENLPVGITVILFFGLLTILPVVHLARKRPVLILEPKGLTDLTLKTERFFPWDEVARIYVMNVVLASLVMVEPKDQEAYRKSLPPTMQKLSSSQPLALAYSDLEMKTPDLEQTIQAYWMKYRTLYTDPTSPPVNNFSTT